jgi:hypothetical protein
MNLVAKYFQTFMKRERDVANLTAPEKLSPGQARIATDHFYVGTFKEVGKFLVPI